MEKLAEYIAFDLEFNTVAEKSHIIQVSAVKFKEGHEVDRDVYKRQSLSINGIIGFWRTHRTGLCV